jgi:hypothetical protein
LSFGKGSKPDVLGETANMSSRGLLVYTDETADSATGLAVGDIAELVVELPEAPYFRGCWLECQCLVARTFQETGSRMIAFEVKRYKFRPRPEALAAESERRRGGRAAVV